jgi:hypothetical protein
LRAWRNRLIDVLPWITGTIVFIELLALRIGLLDRFFYDTMHAANSVQGLDYYSLPKSFLSLAAGHSAYDSFGPPLYAERLTWYLAHPVLSVLLGSWLSRFDPATSYGVFALLSLGMMAGCAWVLAGLSSDVLVRRIIWLLLLGAFPTFWLLYTGNVQALLVLALSMTFAAVFQLARGAANGSNGKRARALLFAGLLLSLLTKPVVLLMLPLLLLLPETRRSAARALAVYVVISVLFEVVPALNPEAIGLGRVAWLMFHPAYVQANMNIYANHYVVTPEMKDNSIHWLNLIAQSSYRMNHIDIFSLPVFLDTLLGVRTPGWLYQLPVLIVAALTWTVFRLHDSVQRLQVALLLLMAISLTFFLGYPTVWEYQYTSVLPVAATLLLMLTSSLRLAGLSPRWLRWMFVLATCAWLPSLYFLTEGQAVDNTVLNLIRADRVIPVTALFCLMVVALVRSTVTRITAAEPAGS